MTTNVLPQRGRIAAHHAPRTNARRALPSRGATRGSRIVVLGRTLLGIGAEAVLACQVFLMVIGVVAAIALRGPTVVVIGDSMQPNVPKGSLVVAIAPDAASIGEGAIVIFDGPNGTVTHRVVLITEQGYVTRGDANAVEDSTPQTIESMQGQARLIVPWVGWPRVWWQERRWFSLGLWLGALGLLLVISSWAARSRRE